MGATWNLVQISDRHYELMNGDGTRLRLSPSSKVDPVELMDEMERIGVPPAFTENLEVIEITILKGLLGDYLNGRLRLSSTAEARKNLGKVFVHELGHHIDDEEEISEDEKIKQEKKKAAKFMSDAYAKKSVGEYVAVGFEVYYYGTKEEKAKMKKKNPVLYRKIASIHEQFKSK